jgi:hypothetical protein
MRRWIKKKIFFIFYLSLNFSYRVFKFSSNRHLTLTNLFLQRVTSVDTSWLIISTCATSVALFSCFPKATGEIHHCWYDEIAALAIFQKEKILHLELHMLLSATSKREIGVQLRNIAEQNVNVTISE